ncbi:MAG TPA: helix-turn-helix domain-containing protein [Rhizomicrobium sp.]|nr:helix-turn-helix domain-containing protein [Rhizomicrobium sp.]
MLSLRRKVPPPLDGFIDFLWYWEGDPATHARDVITAGRTFGILISLHDDELTWYSGERYAQRNRLRGIAVNGTNAGHFAIDAHQPHIMGVAFRPGGAWPFLGPAAHEFGDTHLSLEDVWGRDAERLHQRIVQAPAPDDKFDILFEGLVAIAPRAFALDPAVAFALARFERCPERGHVGNTARDADLSPKKFIRLFTDQVGMTPKLYLRVARFQKVMARIAHAPEIDWWDVVERHGYYDQPHFIREFKGFTGFTPTEWLKLRGPFVGHIPLPE